MEQIFSALAQGLIWAPMGLGVFISFRILRQADLTTEASFTFGAAVGALALGLGIHPLLSLVLSFVAGAAAGAVTGLLITGLAIQPLLAGIITMTGLYSVNLHVLGRANVSLNGRETFRTLLSGFGLPRNVDTLLVGLLISLIAVMLLSAFFRTRVGQALIATGDNAVMARSVGIDTNGMKMLGFMLANGFVALSGNLVAQDNGYADIGMGIGTVVLGLAAVILGEVLRRDVSLPQRLLSILPGSILYRLLLFLVLQFHFDPQNFKLFSALVLTLCLGIPAVRMRLVDRPKHRRDTAHDVGEASDTATLPVVERAGEVGGDVSRKVESSQDAIAAETPLPRLSLRHLDQTFRTGGGTSLHALNDLSLEVEKGDFITIIGANGAGKSTLLNAIAGTFVPEGGEVLLDGVPLHPRSEVQRAGDIARIFQDPKMSTAPRMTVAENLALAAHRGEARSLALAMTEEDRAAYREALAAVNLGLEERLDTEMERLSGGQRQAVALIMATLKQPKVLLLDEHTAALDPRTAQLILEFTERTIVENGLTALMITHNLDDALRYGNRMVTLDKGRVAHAFNKEEKTHLTPVEVFALLGGNVAL